MSDGRGAFDSFAERAARGYSTSYAFGAAVFLILIWVPSLFLIKFDTAQLLINTATTIITFLGLFLVQNQQWRDGQATNKKLNAIADALADFMESSGGDNMEKHVAELRSIVGIEQREGT